MNSKRGVTWYLDRLFPILLVVGAVIYVSGYTTLGQLLMEVPIVAYYVPGLVLAAARLYLSIKKTENRILSALFGGVFLTSVLLIGTTWLLGELYISGLLDVGDLSDFLYVAISVLVYLSLMKVVDIVYSRRLAGVGRVDGGYLHVERGVAYGGFTFGLGTKSFVLIGGEDPAVLEMIRLHEEYHAKNRHPMKLQLYLLAALLLTGIMIRHGLWNTPVYPTAVLALAVGFLVFIRALETAADAYTWRALGPAAYERFKTFLKLRYGVEEPWRAPLWSRLTHTSRRDVTLTTGDPIGAHWRLEFPLAGALASLSLITCKYYLLPQDIIYITLPAAFAGFLAFSISLAYVAKPLIRRLAGPAFTDRGVFNLGALSSSVYTTAAAATVALGPWSHALASAFLAYAMRHYLNSWRRGVALTATVYPVYLALNTAVMSLLHEISPPQPV